MLFPLENEEIQLLESQNIKGFSPNNHFDLTQKTLNLKFMNKIK